MRVAPGMEGTAASALANLTQTTPIPVKISTVWIQTPDVLPAVPGTFLLSATVGATPRTITRLATVMEVTAVSARVLLTLMALAVRSTSYTWTQTLAALTQGSLTTFYAPAI